MRNALLRDVEWTETLETDADLALVVAALGGGPPGHSDPDEGSAAAREADAGSPAEPEAA